MPESPKPTISEIRDWLVERIAQAIDEEEGSVDVDAPLANYGISSLAAVTLTGDLEDWLDLRLPPTLAWDYPTIAALAHHLAGLRDH